MTHLRTNLVGYVALAVALSTGTAYAATKIPNNSVTSKSIKNHSIKPKDLKKPVWVQTQTLLTDTPPAVPDYIALAPYDFTLPQTGRTAVTVFIPTLGGNCDNGVNQQPTIGLYIDNVPIPATAAIVPPGGNDRPIQLTTTLLLGKGAHAGRVGITCPGNSAPNLVNQAGAKSWTILQSAT
jgi:hypothetical protein